MENSLTEIKCLICGLPYRALGRHINSQHGINVVEYVHRFPGAPTTSKELSAKFAEAGTVKHNYVRTEEIRRQTAASVSASLIKGYQEDLTRVVRMGNTLRQTHVDDPSLSVRMSVSQRLSYENDPTRAERHSESMLEAYREDPLIRQKISASLKKTNELDPTIVERRSESCKKTYANDPSIGKGISESLKQGYREDPTRSERKSVSMKKLWLDDEFAKMMGKAWSRKPNFPERYLTTILNTNFPGLWEYTGDGKLNIKGRNPDFRCIDNAHLLEIFGIHFHDPYYFPKRPSEEVLIAHYEKNGFKCLVFWEYDVFDEGDVVKKVKEFMLT